MPADLFSDLSAPSSQSQRDVWTISRLNQEVKHTLEKSFGLLWLQGEISNFSKPASGHYYFSMKDSLAQIRCAMFKGRNRYLDFIPENGMQILARGRLSLYEARGDYQFIVEHIEEVGAGALQRQFEQRFEKLKAEGLFDENRKQTIPEYPKTIGIVTSATGAALQDALDVLARRYPIAGVRIYPTPVQGDGAAAKIAAQIARAAREQQCETLLLVRGGGSMEDLWSFNEEVVVRAVVDCDIPVVCGVGHEIDFTLADFAADVRAPTPSAAAELACPDRAEVAGQFRHWQLMLERTLEDRLGRLEQTVEALSQRLSIQHPQQQLQQKYQRCDELMMRLLRAVDQRRTDCQKSLDQLTLQLSMHSPDQKMRRIRDTLTHQTHTMRASMTQRLTAMRATLQENMHALHVASPMATLERGYSITQHAESISPITLIEEVATGDQLKSRVTNGVIFTTVTKTAPHD